MDVSIVGLALRVGYPDNVSGAEPVDVAMEVASALGQYIRVWGANNAPVAE